MGTGACEAELSGCCYSSATFRTSWNDCGEFRFRTQQDIRPAMPMAYLDDRRAKKWARSIFSSRREKKIQRDRFSSPVARRKSKATDFVLLPGEENPRRPIFFSCCEKKIHGDQFSSYHGMRDTSRGINFAVQVGVAV